MPRGRIAGAEDEGAICLTPRTGGVAVRVEDERESRMRMPVLRLMLDGISIGDCSRGPIAETFARQSDEVSRRRVARRERYGPSSR